MGHQWSHSVRTCSRAPGWPGAGLRTPVNGLPAAAHWAPWTRWPKKSETKMSLSATCRSALDKDRQWPVKPVWLLHWKGDAYHNGGAAPARAAPCAHHLGAGTALALRLWGLGTALDVLSGICIPFKPAVSIISLQTAYKSTHDPRVCCPPIQCMKCQQQLSVELNFSHLIICVYCFDKVNNLVTTLTKDRRIQDGKWQIFCCHSPK